MPTGPRNAAWLVPAVNLSQAGQGMIHAADFKALSQMQTQALEILCAKLPHE